MRWLNAPIEDDDAFERLWEEHTPSDVDESSDSDTESDSEATEAGGAIPVHDRVRDTEGSDGNVDEFNMLTTDMDTAIERAVALPEYFLPEQDDILNATSFRYVYTHLGLFTFNQAAIKPRSVKQDSIFFFWVRVNPLFKAYRLGVCAHVLKRCKQGRKKSDFLNLNRILLIFLKSGT